MSSNFENQTRSPEYTTTDDDDDDYKYEYQIRPSLEYTTDDDDNLCFTENKSATYKSSKNPCLDFFFHVVPTTPSEGVISRAESAWAHDPLTTLKLICNLRSVRGSGKSDKERFYMAALWLHKNHPKTLADNVPNIVSFGYFKDLPEILYRLVMCPEVRENEKRDWLAKKTAKGKGAARKMYFLEKKNERKREKKREKKNEKNRRKSVSREERVKANAARMEEEKQKAKALRREKETAKVKKANDMYNSDMNYKYLYDQVCLYFAVCLKSDIDMLNRGDTKKISLAAKWCPSVDSSYDKALLMCESIGKILYPRDSGDMELDGLDDVGYVMRVKNRLRKEVLVPLRRALMLPEVYMSAKEWSLICYERVASVAMKNYTDIFLHRDNKRFREYLENVKSGDAKIAAGALLPHEIIASLNRGSSGVGNVAELQWARMVNDLLNKGKLTNCIAVCDVSGSMSGTPMEVAVALGLLVSELSAEPWKGHVITFSESPELHLIQGRDLKSKTQFIRNMHWGCNTNFQKVFDRMLEVAVNGKLSEDEMVKRVFVFSDMEFDEASSNLWETDYKVIQRKFKSHGYEKVPEIVFWNLRDSRSTPVTADQEGVALLSGFSKNLLTLFLEEGGVIKPEDLPVKTELNPESIMEAAISGDLYQKLVVCD
uniref:uncharacterized protein LOC122606006 n=1 Tax=Erigeron canadensis TaxID=72917 RepID=UPI001CB97166|nr:uncharacterized protein LOC122606006 [Erigeron canadensis]